MREVDRQALACLMDLDRAIPGVRIFADIVAERKRWADLRRLCLSRLHLLRRRVEPGDLEVVPLLRPLTLSVAQIVVEQFVKEAADDFTVFAIDRNEDADVLFRQ